MRKLLALLCMVVFLFGTALCEETQAVPPEEITILEVPEQEQVPLEEPILEEPIPVEEEPPINSPPTEEEPLVELVPEESVQEELIPQEEEPVPQEEPAQPEEPESVESEPSIEIEEPVESEVEETPETPTEVIEISEEVLTTPMPEPVENEPEVEELPEFEEEIESEEVIVPEELVEIAEDDWGYVDPEMMPREVHISFLTEPRFFGDEAALVLTLVNFRSDDVYTIHWQYCEDVDNPTWIDIPGADARVYTFIVDKTNYLYGYRVLIEMEE